MHVGTVRAKDENVWIATNWAQVGVNLSVGLHPDRLAVELTAWTAAQTGRFLAWLTSTDDRDLEDLQGLARAELVIWRRRAMTDKKGAPYWMHATPTLVERASLDCGAEDLRGAVRAQLERCDPRWDRLAFHVRASWPELQVLDAGTQIANEVLRAVARLAPLVPRINDDTSHVPTAESCAGVTARGLADIGVVLAPRADREPATWRIVVDGPGQIVSSSSGMHGRGLRYHVAQTADGTEFVGFVVTKSYASGGADGFLTVVHRGSDLLRAVQAVNDHALEWHDGEHFDPRRQPRDVGAVDELAVVQALRAGSPFAGSGWSELDAIARNVHGAAETRSWPPEGSAVRVDFSAGENG